MIELGPGIVSIGSCLPEKAFYNSDFLKVHGLDTGDHWIIPRTGIKKRYVAAPGENTSDLATNAAREALARIGMDASALSQIIVATATPDRLFPPTSSYVQQKLNGGTNTPAFDLGNACNGSLAALEMGYALVASGFRANAMVIGVEILTRFVDYSDRTTCVLFGDGAGAALVAPVENPGPYAFVMGTDGSKAENIIYEGGGSVYPATHENIDAGYFKIKMNGKNVFKDAVPCMVKMTNRAMESAGVTKSDVRWWIPHQANLRIMEAAAEKLDFHSKMISYVENMGNTSAASIFVAMTEAFQDGWLQKGDIIAMAAIGSGYNYGGGVIQWQIENPTPRPSGKFSDKSKQ